MLKHLNNILKKFFPFHAYLRNLLIVLSGSTFAELAPILSAPLLTRIYKPSDFGHYALIASLADLLCQFSTLRYENSIVISKEPREVFASLKLCEYLSISLHLLFSLLCFLFIILFVHPNNLSIFFEMCLLLPLTGFGGAFFRIQVLLANREGRFKHASTIKIARAFGIVFLSIGFGLSPFISYGLIWALLLSNLGSGLYLRFLKTTRCKVSSSDLLSALKRYKNFLFYSLPAELISTGTSRYPLLAFPLLMGEAAGGYLALAYQVVAVPSRFVAKAVGEIFFQSARVEMIDRKECRSLFFFTAGLLSLCGVIGFGILFFSSDLLFSLFFGKGWEETASFVKILIPLFLASFVVSPLSSMIYVAEKQSWDLMWQVGYLFVAVGSSLLSWIIFKNTQTVLFYFVACSTAMYFVYFFLLFTLATGRTKLFIKKIKTYEKTR